MTEHSFAFIIKPLHEKSQCTVVEWVDLSHIGLDLTIPAQILNDYVSLKKLLNFVLLYEVRKLNTKQLKHI